MNDVLLREIREASLRPGEEGLGGCRWEVDEEALIEETVRRCIECIQLTMYRDGHNTAHYQQSVRHINMILTTFGIEQ